MRDLRVHTIAFWILLAVYIVGYLMTFPSGWLISDEYTYTNQAMSICAGQEVPGYSDVISGDFKKYASSGYAYGNAFWIAIWMAVFGLSWSYLGSMVAIALGLIWLFAIIRHDEMWRPAIVLAFLYPAVVFFSHTQMSGIPSFLLVCGFLYGLFLWEESSMKWLVLCAIAAFSFWFRETNIILLGGICLIHFLQDRRWLGFYIGGTMVGMLPRLISHLYYYNDPLYYVLGESFAVGHIVQNIGVYAILGLLMMPLGWMVLCVYRGRYRWPIMLSSLIFIGVYLVYGYNAIAYSGVKTGVMVMSRFYLPLLPIYVITVGFFLRDYKTPRMISVMIYCAAIVGVAALHYITDREAQVHAEASAEIYDSYSDQFAFYDLSKKTNIIRYLNPYHGLFVGQADLSSLSDSAYLDRVLDRYGSAVVFSSQNIANAAKQEKTDFINQRLQIAEDRYTMSDLESIQIKPGLYIKVMKIQRR